MSRSLLKYANERRHPETGRDLMWPGTPDGFPVIGHIPPNLKGDEVADIPYRLDFQSYLFHLWDDNEWAVYNLIKDKIANGLYLQYERIPRWDKEHKNYTIYLEWVEVYGEVQQRGLTSPPGSR